MIKIQHMKNIFNKNILKSILYLRILVEKNMNLEWFNGLELYKLNLDCEYIMVDFFIGQQVFCVFWSLDKVLQFIQVY